MEASSGEDTLKLVSELVPEIILLDLIKPDMDGVEVTHHVKQIYLRTQINILTSNRENSHIFSSLKAGAISYVLKDATMEWLAEE